MKRFLKNVILTRVLDILLSPLTLIASVWFKYCRYLPVENMPVTDSIFMKLGVLPVVDHYYQPLVNPKKHLSKSLRQDRILPGIDWNVEEQLSILEQFNYNNELIPIPQNKTGILEFYYNNDSFLGGDAEYLYNIIRLKKPKKIFEIGCGYSSLLIEKALGQNKKIDIDYCYKHVCIEPYEMPWLEQLNITVVRKKVEELDPTFFSELQAEDILFIDSSHVIRPQGDVLCEFLELLPTLNSGVIVHVHDIFSPKDYLDKWVFDHKLWNEQYLLEAFLTGNTQYKIIGALNFLKHHYFNQIASKCPQLSNYTELEPGSFWMQKI